MDITVETLETPALTKAQLAELLFEQIGLNKRESKDMVDAFFDLVSNSLVDGDDVKITGFGNFQIRTKSPRPGRNPRTGEAIPIAARRVVTFHASQKLKEQIQAGASANRAQVCSFASRVRVSCLYSVGSVRVRLHFCSSDC
jgi:integration host factor subunit alpha